MTIIKFFEELSDIAAWREAREDTILEAFRLSDRNHSYAEIRDKLLAERGLGKIED